MKHPLSAVILAVETLHDNSIQQNERRKSKTMANSKLRYEFLTDYSSSLGVWVAGEQADFDTETLEWINRDLGQDAVGTLVALVGTPPAMGVSDGQTRVPVPGGPEAGRGAQEVMSTANAGAVRRK